MAFVEDFFDILHRVHAQQQGHLGYKKTLAEVWNDFFCHYVIDGSVHLLCRSLPATTVFRAQLYSSM